MSKLPIETKEFTDTIIKVRPTLKRKGWEAFFKEMSENRDDVLVMPDLSKDELIPDNH